MGLGDKLQIILLVEYALIAAAFLYDGNLPKCFYFLAAGAITLSVLFMK